MTSFASVPAAAKRARNAAFSASSKAMRWSTLLGATVSESYAGGWTGRDERATGTPPGTPPSASSPSATHSCQPGGGSGQEGSGVHPFGGGHPSGGFGHPGGGLNIKALRSLTRVVHPNSRRQRDRMGSSRPPRPDGPASEPEPRPTS